MALIDSGKTFDKEKHQEKMKTRMRNMTNVQYPLRVPQDLYRKVRIKLAEDERNLRSLLIEALENYVNK